MSAGPKRYAFYAEELLACWMAELEYISWASQEFWDARDAAKAEYDSWVLPDMMLNRLIDNAALNVGFVRAA